MLFGATPGAVDALAGRVVTFDLFSALIDTRTGAGAALERLAHHRGWPVRGVDVFDAWDPRHKEAQRRCLDWVPFREPARRALAATYEDLGLAGDPGSDLETMLDSLGSWPLWPDVEEGLPRLGGRVHVGLLSNVDDALFLRTRAAALVDHRAALTSERLRAYKPSPALYHRARAALPTMVHVATSARDVRGSLEAGIPVIRLRRPGHCLDERGPRPPVEVASVDEVLAAVPAALAHADPRRPGQAEPRSR